MGAMENSTRNWESMSIGCAKTGRGGTTNSSIASHASVVWSWYAALCPGRSKMSIMRIVFGMLSHASYQVSQHIYTETLFFEFTACDMPIKK